MGKTKRKNTLNSQLDELRDLIIEHELRVQSFVAKVKRMPQGAERWNLEEWIISELRVDPIVLGPKAGARRARSREEWLADAMVLKGAARRYREAGKHAKAEECEAEAIAAERRAAWMS